MRALLSVAIAVGGFAQTFEVASVKPTVLPERVYIGPARGGPGTSDPGQITWNYARFIDLMMTAYDVKPFQINGPSWISTERYNVIAKVPEGATKEQLGPMWQSLLTERFGLALHRESKEFQVEELVIAKGGHKLKETTLANPDAEGPPQIDKNGALNSPGFVNMLHAGTGGTSVHTIARAQNLSKLAVLLSNQVGRPVLDKTGLTGRYDFELDFTANLPGSANADTPSDPGMGVADALQRQLGLRMVAAKAKLDVLIIDKAEKVPTAN